MIKAQVPKQLKFSQSNLYMFSYSVDGLVWSLPSLDLLRFKDVRQKYLQNLRFRPPDHREGVALRDPPARLTSANAKHEGVSCFTLYNSNLSDSGYFTDFTCLYACTGSLLGLLTFCYLPTTCYSQVLIHLLGAAKYNLQR